MTNTMEELIERLVKSGLSEVEAENLIARFLEENAAEYLKVLEIKNK